MLVWVVWLLLLGQLSVAMTHPLFCQVCNSILCKNVVESNGTVSCQFNLTECEQEQCSSEQVCVGLFTLDLLHGHTLTSRCSNNTTPVFSLNDCGIVREECVLEQDSQFSFVYTCCCKSTGCLLSNISLPVVRDSSVVTEITSTKADPQGDGSTAVIVPAIVIPLVVAILFACLLVLCCWKLKMGGVCTKSSGGRVPVHEEEEFAMSRQGAPLPWTLQQLVGQGRFGTVFCASYQDQLIAVKVYSLTSRSSWENERDVSSLDSTPHHHVVEYLTDISQEAMAAAGPAPPQLYLVTKFYPMGSLLEYLQGQVISWSQVCRIIVGVASGLRHLHDNHYFKDGVRTDKYPVAHRDLKSSNVLMRGEDGDCVLADLGLALVLKPINDPMDIANCGQVGTPRYMSPEALEARINLYDIQSFKQIDMYALGLVMWEVMTRCCVTSEEDLAPYQPPYWDLVPRATIEQMKEVVCVQECRPSMPAIWNDHESLSQYAGLVKECLDRDPEARPSAGNIVYHVDALLNSTLQDLQREMDATPDNRHTSTSIGAPPLGRSHSYISSINPVLIPENSQSSPPPCYSPTNPSSIPFLGRMRAGINRNSMPHIIQTDVLNDSNYYRPSRSLRSSVTTPPAQLEVEESLDRVSHQLPASMFQARNFVFLTHEVPLPTDNISADSGSSSMAYNCRGSEGCGSNLEPEHNIHHSDSGIQTPPVLPADNPQQ